MRFQSVMTAAVAVMFVCVITWAVKDEMRPYKNAAGELNVSVVGSAFGSVGKGDIRWRKMIVKEIGPGGFVGVSYTQDGRLGYYGAINPIDGVLGLAVGDWVRVEERVYIGPDGDSGPKTIWLITKKIEKKGEGK